MSPRVPQAGKIPLPGEWATLGACRGKPTAWWYPGLVWRGTRWPDPADRAWAVWAKGICAHCPVSGPCLDHALRYREVGIWGGKSDAERRGMRRGRGAA